MAFKISDFGDSMKIEEPNRFVAYLINNDGIYAFRTAVAVFEYLEGTATDLYIDSVTDWFHNSHSAVLSKRNGAFTDVWVKHLPPDYLD